MRPYNKHKLDFRSACCLFLGYSLHNKGYICLSSSGKTFISRHVVFNEDVFPYSNPQYGFLPALSTPSISPPIHPTLTVLSSPTHSTIATSASLPTSSLHLQQSSSCSTAPITRNSSPTHNIHPMKTRAKAGIVKPKIFSAHTDSGSPEPTTVAAAFASPQWTQAMNDEYRALITNGTWTLTSLPPGANLVGCKWIFKHKFNADGSFQRHKARLVAKGYSQSEGLDYSATFSPVVKPTTIRVVLAHAVSSHWPIHQIDINNAFLNGDLHEHVYMQQPPGFLATNPKLVCKLHKAMYGLKQAPRAWFQKLSHTLNNIGFRSTISDPSLFVRFANSSTLFVLIYVDDIIITGSSSTAITSLITTLSSHFALKDLGPLHHFLGIEVSTLPSGHLHLSQRRYIQNLLHRTNMLDSNPQPTPMISSLKLPKDATAAVPDPSMFRSVVGALQYALFTRPELTYSVNKVSQFMHSPQEHHWKAVKRILRYLKGTLHHGLLIKCSTNTDLMGFCDSDWGNDIDDRKSTTGYCVYFGSNIVSWSSHKQKVVSRSSTEAEYRGIAAVLTDIIWLQSLLSELRIFTSVPNVYSDNLGAVLLSANPILHSKTKHFELDLHFVRDHIQHQRACLTHILARFQVADILTKPISGASFTTFRDKLMVLDNPTLSLRGLLTIL